MNEVVSRLGKSIIQLATPAMEGGAIHILRLSGKESLDFALRHMATKPGKITPRKLYYSSFLRDKGDRDSSIDSLLWVYFREPSSYTGEDVVELQIHGSLSIADSIMKLAIQEGLVAAQRGEFSRRAYLNGKLSITQAQAIQALIQAKSDYSRENALKLLEKRSSFQFVDLQRDILSLQAQLEASIEFPEEDIDYIQGRREELYKNYAMNMHTMKGYFEKLLQNYRRGRKLEGGLGLLILGPVNAGKSTLLNSLLAEERSLVSNEKGTTRDYLSERLEWQGIPIKIFDTAGIRETDERLEQQGIEKTFQLIDRVDVILILYALDIENNADNTAAIWETALQGFLKKLLSNIAKKERQKKKHHYLFCLNKTDLLPEAKREALLNAVENVLEQNNLNLAASFSLLEDPLQAEESIRLALLSIFEEKTQIGNAKDTALPDLFGERSLALLNEAQAHVSTKILENLGHLEERIRRMESEELLVEELRCLSDYFEELNINTGDEKVLDALFSDFCIGK